MDPASRTNMPERVDRYELLLPIGRGGMGAVYLARAPLVAEHHRLVALKLLGLSPEDSHLDEARLAGAIRHPNVVPVIDAGQSPHGVYMVMEYVEGTTLFELLARAGISRVPLPIAARILCDALAGLIVAHELADDQNRPLRMVHRDFSPQNILVGVDGVARLTDFGIAKATTRESVTKSGVVKGKAGYMAPEQVAAGELDQRADVWAAGVVAWELLAGRRLFRGKDALVVMMSVVKEDIPHLSALRPELPAAIADAVHAALVRDPESRLETARELRQRLLDAFKSSSGVADILEVADYVTRVVGDELEERRERVAALSSGVVRRVPEAITNQDPSDASDDTVGTVSLEGNRQARLKKSLRAVAFGTLGILAVVLGTVFVLSKRKPPDEPALVPGVSATLVPSQTAVAAAATAEVALRIEAPVAIQRVQIGTRSVDVAPASSQARIVLLDGERDKSLTLIGRTKGGRTLTGRIEPGDTSVTLSFPPASGKKKGAPVEMLAP